MRDYVARERPRRDEDQQRDDYRIVEIPDNGNPVRHQINRRQRIADASPGVVRASRGVRWSRIIPRSIIHPCVGCDYACFR